MPGRRVMKSPAVHSDDGHTVVVCHGTAGSCSRVINHKPEMLQASLMNPLMSTTDN
jgi:hypothetical protein